MGRPLIHIGYQKTGTTWLQRFLFAEGAGAGFAALRKRLIRRQLIIPHALDFDPERARSRLGAAVEDAAADGRVAVVSAERLSGAPHSGGYDVKELAERVRAALPEGRVLIVIREQREMIASSYRQYVHVGGSLPPHAYLRPPEAGATRMPMFELDHFAYHRLIELYQRLFGRDRVLVLPYELLRSDPRDFVGRIVAFAEAPTADEKLGSLPFARERNVAPVRPALAVRRVLNRFAANDRVNPSPPFAGARAERLARRSSRRLGAVLPKAVGVRFERRLVVAVDAAADDRYRESNRATAALTGLDLAALGYDV